MTISPKERDYLALTLVPGLGPRLTAALIEHFGSAGAVLQASETELMEIPHIGKKLAHDFAEAMKKVDVDGEVALLGKYNTRILTLGNRNYPASLAQIPDPPPVLYFRGEITPEDANAVAIVGSRQCTTYGKKVTAQIAAGLARAGITVVSGLARGIDGAAHLAALEAGGRTVAVLAGGLSSIYPPEHLELSQLVEQHGALISETAMKMEPLAGMFHARNRIISGLARALVVIEANDRSGALITTRHAAEQGRELFAVPANVDSATSAGTLKLLRDGARLIRNVDDLLEDLEGIAPMPVQGEPKTAPAEEPKSPPPPKIPNGLDSLQTQIWECLSEPKQIDVLTRELKLPVAELSRHLMLLEMKKIIRRLPGNQYERRS
jgi:DNA processing protein